MEIIKKTEGLTAADLFALTKGNDVRKMADAKGETIEIAKYVLYTDADIHGEIMKVLAVETVQGVRYATNSATFIRNFTDILTIFEESGEVPPTRYLVGSARSRNGRDYLTCSIA